MSFDEPLRLGVKRWNARAYSVGDWLAIVGGWSETSEPVDLIEFYNPVSGACRAGPYMQCRQGGLLLCFISLRSLSLSLLATVPNAYSATRESGSWRAIKTPLQFFEAVPLLDGEMLFLPFIEGFVAVRSSRSI